MSLLSFQFTMITKRRWVQFPCARKSPFNSGDKYEYASFCCGCCNLYKWEAKLKPTEVQTTLNWRVCSVQFPQGGCKVRERPGIGNKDCFYVPIEGSPLLVKFLVVEFNLLELVCCKKRQKIVPDQFLVCGIGDL